jgi:hypothetical protein
MFREVARFEGVEERLLGGFVVDLVKACGAQRGKRTHRSVVIDGV